VRHAPAVHIAADAQKPEIRHVMLTARIAIALTADMSHAHLFDPETEQSVLHGALRNG
jgi:hypothetical protein